MSALVDLVIPILSVFAVILPTAVYVLLIWWIDRYEKEPLRLLATAFLWGAIPAVLASSVIEIAFDAPLVALLPDYSELLHSSFIAPPVEELLKGLALAGIFWLARYEFDDVLDGIIYGSLIGFGFGMTENLFYFWSVEGDDLISWIFVVLGRSVVFGFNHAMFTSLTGIGFGLARYADSSLKRWGAIVTGLVAAMMAHIFHNFFLSMGDACFISLISDWLGVLVVAFIVLLVWRRERKWVTTQLAEEVPSGVLAPSQYEAIISWRGRAKRTWQALGLSGLRQANSWRRLVDAATELAFKKHQQAVMGDEKGNSATIAALRAKIMHIRQRLGDEAVQAQTPCPHCGRPTTPEMATVCPYCGTSWREESEE